MNSGGPQSVRDKSWLRKPAELAGEREELIVDRNAEKQVYEGELTRLRKENHVLRDQLQRCHVELRSYQVKYPNEAVHVETTGENDDLPPWVTSAEHMTPLLQVYDERIAELQKELAHQRDMVDSFQEKMEEILAENEALRESQFQHLQEANEGGMNPLGPHNIELFNELNERLKLLVNENALLVEEKAELSGEIEETLGELELRTEAVTKLSNQLGILSQEIQVNRQKLSQAEKDREDAANSMMKCKDRLHQIEIDLNDSQEQLSVWEERCLNAEKKNLLYEQQLQQLTQQLDDDGLKTIRKFKSFEDRVKELQLQLLQKSQEAENAQEVARKLRREYQSTRQDAEGMLTVMSGLERQLAEYSNRESEIERLAVESKERLEEAYVARDQATTREEQLKRDVERLHEDRKKAALQKQHDIESAVEVAKSVAASQISSLERDIEELSGRVTRSKAEAERIGRELKSSQSLLERTRLSMEEERKSYETGMKKFEDRLKELTISKEDALMRVKTVQEMNTELRLTIDKLRSQEDHFKGLGEEKERYKEKEIEKLRSVVRELQREQVERQSLCERLEREYGEYKENKERQLSEDQKRREDEMELYKQRCQEAEQSVKEMELIANAENHRAKLIIEQFKEKSNLLNLQMESKLSENKEKIRQLTEKLRESENKVKEHDRVSIERRRETEEMKEKLLRLQDQNREYEHEVEELNTQLTISLQAREALHKSRMSKSKGNGKGKYRREQEGEEGGDGEGGEEEFSADEDEIDDIINEITED